MKIQFDYKEPAEILVASIIAIALGGLVLICDKRGLVKFAPLIIIIAFIAITNVITIILIHLHLIRLG